MKNELILARFTGHRKHSAGQRLKALLQEFALEPLLATRYPALVDELASLSGSGGAAAQPDASSAAAMGHIPPVSAPDVEPAA